MNCINFKNSAQPVELLTQADKISRLEEIFIKYRHKTDIFLPDENFYNEISSPDDAKLLADKIFRWLGIKHRSLDIRIDPAQDQLVVYTRKSGSSTINLGWRVLNDPFLCGAALAHGITHHLLLSRAKLHLESSEENEALTDLGTIYSGLGVLILNGFSSGSDALGSMAQANYIAECLDYFEERRIVKSLWQPYVLPSVISNVVPDKLPIQNYSMAVRQQINKMTGNRTKTALVLMMIIILIGTSVFVYVKRPKNISAEMQSQKETIDILKIQYQQCIDTVEYKRQTRDLTDIFMQRNIEADQSRCTSLRNRYNYEVAQYNSKLK